jgi:uncharacterized protein
MNPKKLKDKDRRRARKLADEAWAAVDAGNLDLAEKIVRRAVAAQSDNPVLWDDQGVILGLRGKEAEAAEAFRTALSLAPTFAEPFAHLADLRARQGFAAEAVSLQTEAARLAPDNPTHTDRLAAYRALAAAPEPPAASNRPEAPTDPDGPNEWPERVVGRDWPRLAERLTRDGCVLIPALVDAPTCACLRNLYGDCSLFAKTVVMDRPDFGRGEYRYFSAPLPATIDQLRRAVYPHVARITNDWQRLLGEAERFPPEWAEFRDECRAAGQTTPTPILLKYPPGGFNALHRDLRGTVFFPIQMAVILSPRADPADLAGEGFRGGDFLFCDAPAGRKPRRRELPAGLGDAVLFCTRDRLVPVGGVYGLQPVKHGVTTIEAGTRFVLGVPFHEYR